MLEKIYLLLTILGVFDRLYQTILQLVQNIYKYFSLCLRMCIFCSTFVRFC